MIAHTQILGTDCAGWHRLGLLCIENRDIFQYAIITPQMQPDRWTMSQACHLNYSHVAVGTFELDGWKAVLPKHVAP